MDVTLNIFGIGGIVVLAMVIGYFLGRGNRAVLEEREEEQEPKAQEIDRRRMVQGRSIASPVAGKVGFFSEDGRKGVVIEPEQGMLYAPVSGKIIKLYPMGNAFLLQSAELGEVVELMIQVGRRQPDELCSTCFRSRVVQNEVVARGKLLLQFDKDSLQAAGEDTAVYVSPENSMSERELVVTQKERVKVGEELYRICR